MCISFETEIYRLSEQRTHGKVKAVDEGGEEEVFVAE